MKRLIIIWSILMLSGLRTYSQHLTIIVTDGVVTLADGTRLEPGTTSYKINKEETVTFSAGSHSKIYEEDEGGYRNMKPYKTKVWTYAVMLRKTARKKKAVVHDTSQVIKEIDEAERNQKKRKSTLGKSAGKTPASMPNPEDKKKGSSMIPNNLIYSQERVAQNKDSLPKAVPKVEKRGFIQHIDAARRSIAVDFIEYDKIISKTITITDAIAISDDKNNPLTFGEIREHDEIIVEELAQSDAITDIHRVENNNKSKTATGRIDYISGDMAVIDGHKVKLPEDIKINGKYGYKNRTFNSINELRKGDFAKVKGKYTDGILLAAEFTVEPNRDSDRRMETDSIAEVEYHEIYPKWTDIAERKKLFNKDIPDMGKIYNDQAIQEYINNIGQKLLTGTAEDKSKYIFVVVDNPGLYATVNSNGLAFVSTGLIAELDNEAQLATVMGFEISHAIDGHTTKEKYKGSAIKNKNSVALIKPNIKKNDSGRKFKEYALIKKIDEEDKKSAAHTAISLADRYAIKNIKLYSASENDKADRVGLSLMALAGYDPGEAATTWKKIYGRYGGSDFARQELMRRQREGLSESRGAVSAGVRGLSNWKTETYDDNEIYRIKAINKLIDLYWNDPALLQNATDNKDYYQQITRRLKKGKR